MKYTIPRFYLSTNDQIADVFNQETKIFGETERENYDRKESSLTYKKIADNIKKYAIKAEQRRKSMKHAKEIRPLLQYELSRLEFAMKTFYETKIRNFLLLEKRKWEDFVFDLVKSKINGRQDSGSANHSTEENHSTLESTLNLWLSPWFAIKIP